MLSNRIVPFGNLVQVEYVEVEQGKFVYLIEVPESEAKPHQFDNVYYVRLDGQTKIAPHYIIDALFKQIKFADLNVFIRLDGFQNLDKEVGYRSVNICFTCFLINSSKFIHEYEPYYLVRSSLGKFFKVKNQMNVLSDTLHIHSIPAITALTYNTPLVRQETLHLTIDEYYGWCDTNKPISISIFGGGRSTPPKTSMYEIRLKDAMNNKDLVLSRSTSVDRVMELVPTSLNQFAHDAWTGTEKDRLDEIVRFSKAL